MLCLCVDSCGDQAVLALTDQCRFIDYTIVTANSGWQPTSQSVCQQAVEHDRVGAFLHALDDLLVKLKCDCTDLTAIVVVAGPGRYTGLRLGLAMVAGLTADKDNPIPVYSVRRDIAYRHLLPCGGIMLLESGRKQDFVVMIDADQSIDLLHMSGSADETPRLMADSEAVQLFRENVTQVLSLIHVDQLKQRYPALLSVAKKNDAQTLLLAPQAQARALATLARMLILAFDANVPACYHLSSALYVNDPVHTLH